MGNEIMASVTQSPSPLCLRIAKWRTACSSQGLGVPRTWPLLGRSSPRHTVWGQSLLWVPRHSAGVRGLWALRFLCCGLNLFSQVELYWNPGVCGGSPWPAVYYFKNSPLLPLDVGVEGPAYCARWLPRSSGNDNVALCTPRGPSGSATAFQSLPAR